MDKKLALVGLFALLLNSCTMGQYRPIASTCTTKSVVYENSPKKDCYCPKAQKACLCEIGKNSAKLHAYSRD